MNVTRLNHDVPAPSGDEEDDGDRCSDRIDSKDVNGVEFFDRSRVGTVAANNYVDVYEAEAGTIVDQTAIIGDFLVDVGLPGNSLSGGISESFW